jgi:serine/threonine protein kinase
VRFALDACAGLSAVHAAGLVHRDLKPANLFVTTSKLRGEVLKILDFGVAKAHTSEATNQGALIGTVRYMAPEQLSDGPSVRATADVYAVGAILFECLTGRPAHSADTPQELMFDVLNRDPPLATELRPELPAHLAEIVATAMARRAADRFQSAAELATAIKPFTSLGESGGDDTTLDGTSNEKLLDTLAKRRRDRTRTTIGLGLGAAFAAGFAAGSAFLSARTRTPEPATARAALEAAPDIHVAPKANDASPSVRPTTEIATFHEAPVQHETVVPKRPAVVSKPSALVSARGPKAAAPAAPVVLDVKNPYDE